MKSLFIAILLASTTSQAQTPPLAYPDLFVCDVKTQETDAAKYMFQFGGKSKGSSQQSSSKKEQLSEFVQKELFPSMIVSQFKFEKPLHIKGNTRGFDIDLDFSTNLTFSNELMYKLGGNAKISQGVYLVGKNSKILMHSKTYRLNDPSLSESLRKADEINEAILKDISSRMGTTFSETQVPRISTEVSFSDSTSGQAKPMRIRLVGTKTTQTITGVQLNGLTGSTLLIKVNGVNILLYSFHANLEFAASFNT